MKKSLFILSLAFFCFLFSNASAQTYSKGEKVEAFWQGAWQKSTIDGLQKPGYYKVHFDGYWASREQILPNELIRPILKRVQPDLNSLKSGTAIEFLDGDAWRPAVFVELQGKKALIRTADDKPKLISASKMSEAPQPPAAAAK